jgi:hypothetical protein
MIDIKSINFIQNDILFEVNIINHNNIKVKKKLFKNWNDAHKYYSLLVKRLLHEINR